MSVPRDFHADLAMSEQPDVVAAVKAAIKARFPEVLNIAQAHKQNDILGADYWLEFQGCKMETLDTKIRKLDYSLRGDKRIACLELVANTTTGQTGWTLDPAKRTDWVMFFYCETGSSVFYNARELRAAVLAYLPQLKTKGKASTQRTGNYESKSLFVSHRELWAAIYHNAAINNDNAIAA